MLEFFFSPFSVSKAQAEVHVHNVTMLGLTKCITVKEAGTGNHILQQVAGCSIMHDCINYNFPVCHCSLTPTSEQLHHLPATDITL
jgi:hypothetical protein